MSEINAFTILMKGAKRCKRSRTTDSAGPTSTSKRAKTTEVLTIVIDDDSPEKSEYSHSTTLPEPSQLYSPEVYTKNVNKDLVWNESANSSLRKRTKTRKYTGNIDYKEHMVLKYDAASRRFYCEFIDSEARKDTETAMTLSVSQSSDGSDTTEIDLSTDLIREGDEIIASLSESDILSARTSSPTDTPSFVPASQLLSSTPPLSSSSELKTNVATPKVELDEWAWTKYMNNRTLGSAYKGPRQPAQPNKEIEQSEPTAIRRTNSEVSPRYTRLDECFGDGSLELLTIDATNGAAEWSADGITLPPLAEHCNVSLSNSVLKSLLQKSVRRSRAWPSVRIAKVLMLRSFSDFLRRITVICMEDSLLHPDLPVVVWLMIHTYHNPLFRPSAALLSFVLHIVYDIAEIKFRDSYQAASDAIKLLHSNTTAHKTHIPTGKQLQELRNQSAANLIKSLLIRACYGGMKFDVKMLHTLAKLWTLRFEGKPGFSFPQDAHFAVKDEDSWWTWLTRTYNSLNSLNEISWASVGSLSPHDLLLDGVDFHCSNMVTRALQDKKTRYLIDEWRSWIQTQSPSSPLLTQDEESLLKDMIWWFRSSINNKRSICGHHESDLNHKQLVAPLFDKLRDTFDRYAIGVLLRGLH